ncbi:hypothetical protein BDV96DRAFT_690123 [Lophiotrema nucula]|uniref:Uncharacterized protein n=1 Tax=Lophiotrema nucula TaxID=690887 RepID=A0A6A5YY52_9PLEO|nr:hypothetical protein BDV96DRAFT_690123 [Lophiotrema nucula]
MAIAVAIITRSAAASKQQASEERGRKIYKRRRCSSNRLPLSKQERQLHWRPASPLPVIYSLYQTIYQLLQLNVVNMSSSGAPPPPTPPSSGGRRSNPSASATSPQIFSPRRTRDGQVRNGLTVQTPLTSLALDRELHADPDHWPTYVVRDVVRRIFLETTVQEARDYADQGHAVYDTNNHHRVEWAVRLPSEGKGHEGAFEGQFVALDKANDDMWDAEMNPPDSPSAGKGKGPRRDGPGSGSPPAGGAGTGTGSGSNVVST